MLLQTIDERNLKYPECIHFLVSTKVAFDGPSSSVEVFQHVLTVY